MAPDNKLLLRHAGEAMVTRVLDAAIGSEACGVWLVLGHQAEQVSAAIGGREVQRVYAPDYAAGMAFSLVSGIAALPAEVEAALVCLGDMPEITSSLINEIIGAYDPDAGRLIVVPVHRGRRGNPVLWDRRFFADILALSGDRGARALLGRHAAQVCALEVASDAVLRDYDTHEALAGMR